MTYVRKMIVWASGMIEFLGDVTEPDGSILCCTIRHAHAFEDLLAHVQDNAVLHDFGDVVGLRVPGINPNLPACAGFDDAVEILIRWEDDLRDLITHHNDIEWTRS